MVSSYFRRVGDHRPTPATCWPPRPPEPETGWIPCLEGAWTNLVLVRCKLTFRRRFIEPNPTFAVEVSNLANINIEPGLQQWIADCTAAPVSLARIGLRCSSAYYGPNAWSVFLKVRATMPDGVLLQEQHGWQPSPSWSITWDGPNPILHAELSSRTTGDTGLWVIHSSEATFSAMAENPRSRPPHPMIPPIA